jgi:alkanesulfonate monooxygenase SsuD/methylene tetrahydromethanopterin reductase-like flavin-dependent oxidoreductase (luciferase family)
MFMMRFAMRTAATSADERADLYRTAIEMCEWADSRGGMCVLSQHHASADGYLPSPLPMAAAIAARTTAMPILVAALLAPLYEPVKLAEDIAIVDLISRGRVSYVVGIGYRDEEFALFGVDRRTRARVVEERLLAMRQLWNGEEATIDGRRVRITPLPYVPGGPSVAYGGGTEAAARRAARLGMPFVSEKNDPELEAAYNDEAAKTGSTPLGCAMPQVGQPSTVFVADDPDKAWDEIGSYLMRDALSYSDWNAHKEGIASVSRAATVNELKAERGWYQIVTPAQAAELGKSTLLGLQPLIGGLPPDIAWRYLETAAAVTA